MIPMKMFNSHVHTNNSDDCKSSIEKMCAAAYENGLGGISVTDHCNIASCISDNSYSRIKKSSAEAAEMKKKYADKLYVGVGVEIGDAIWNLQYTERILKMSDFDVILASVHRVRHDIIKNYFSRVDFSETDEAVLYDYMDSYFDDLLDTAINCDYDVLAHMTIPLRYINGKFGRNISVDRFEEKIDRILSAVIDREKALELNTSEVGRIGFMPDEKILRRYRELGGRYISIGADSHLPENICYGISEGIECLKKCGFGYYVHFEKRQAVKNSLVSTIN